MILKKLPKLLEIAIFIYSKILPNDVNFEFDQKLFFRFILILLKLLKHKINELNDLNSLNFVHI